LEKELLTQANESGVKQEMAEKKRKRTEETDDDVAYISDGNELFVAASASARKLRSRGRAGIETINLIDDLDVD
jgi:hypothetical protein